MSIKQKIKNLFGGKKEPVSLDERVKILEDKVKELENKVNLTSRPAPSGRRLG